MRFETSSHGFMGERVAPWTLLRLPARLTTVIIRV